MSLPQDILNLDFAALRTLRLVYQKASFAAAAEELGMNASSVSYTIERVRKAASDPLFVRQGGGIVPTDPCRALMHSVERILAEAEHISGEEDFDPATVETELRISGNPMFNVVLAPRLLQRLRKEAPGIRIKLDSDSSGSRDKLLADRVDIAIHAPMIDSSGIYVAEDIIPDQHVCIMDPSHPFAAKRIITAQDLASADQVRFEATPGWMQSPFRHVYALGLPQRWVVTTTNPQECADLVEHTDLIGVLPRCLAVPWRGRLELRPFDFPTPAFNHMFWTAASHRSKVKSWVRSLILEESRRLPEPVL